MSEVDLPDVNVWIAMSAPDHAHHDIAQRYWRNEAMSTIAFNAVTMMGLVRLFATAPLYEGRRLDPTSAWAVFQSWMHQPETIYLPEPAGCRDTLDELVRAGHVLSKEWTDAYLAAFATAGRLRLVTLDRGFRHYPSLDLLELSTAP